MNKNYGAVLALLSATTGISSDHFDRSPTDFLSTFFNQTWRIQNALECIRAQKGRTPWPAGHDQILSPCFDKFTQVHERFTTLVLMTKSLVTDSLSGKDYEEAQGNAMQGYFRTFLAQTSQMAKYLNIVAASEGLPTLAFDEGDVSSAGVVPLIASRLESLEERVKKMAGQHSQRPIEAAPTHKTGLFLTDLSDPFSESF